MTDVSPFGAAFIRGLAQHGYALGHNVQFERPAAEGHLGRLPRLLDELAESKVDLILTLGYPAALAAKQKNAGLAANQKSTIPVVAFAAGDPVSTGLVSSLARPGGSITGISDVSAELTPKRMELLKQVVPALKRVAILWNAGDLGMTMRYRASETGAKALGVSVQPLGVREPDVPYELTSVLAFYGQHAFAPTSWRAVAFSAGGDGGRRPPELRPLIAIVNCRRSLASVGHSSCRRHRQFLARASRCCAAGRHYQFA